MVTASAVSHTVEKKQQKKTFARLKLEEKLVINQLGPDTPDIHSGMFMLCLFPNVVIIKRDNYNKY